MIDPWSWLLWLGWGSESDPLFLSSLEPVDCVQTLSGKESGKGGP